VRINKSLITYTPTSGAGSGTVTSVAMTVPSGVFFVLGTPITSSGTLQVGLVNQFANTVWAGPVSGAEDVPDFRALVEADIPNLSASKITSGTLGVARGGTGATTLTGVVIGSGTSALSGVASTTPNQLLRVNSSGNGYEFYTPSFLTSITANAPLSYNSGTNTLSITLASSGVNGYLSGTDWVTFFGKQDPITLTTTGNNGAATFVGATLNIPEYTLAGLGGFVNPMTTVGDIIIARTGGEAFRFGGNTSTTRRFFSQIGNGTAVTSSSWYEITATDVGAVPTSRTITINDVVFDLSANREWSVGNYGTW